MDFYQRTSVKMLKLSTTEQNIFNYIMKNMHRVSSMSIRDLAAACFVSTTTIFRLTKKLGFEGYADFIEAVHKTESETRQVHIPQVIHNDNYRDSYLKNVVETVKVVTDEKIDKFHTIMNRNPHIYLSGRTQPRNRTLFSAFSYIDRLLCGTPDGRI